MNKKKIKDNLKHLFDDKSLRVKDFGILKHLTGANDAIGSNLDAKAKEELLTVLPEAMETMLESLSTQEGFENIYEQMNLPQDEGQGDFLGRLENTREYKALQENFATAFARARSESRKRAGLEGDTPAC